MDKIIFEQENVLSKICDEKFLNDKVKKSFIEAVEVFERKNIFIITRISEPEYYLENVMNLKYFPVDELRETIIKPFNFKTLVKWTKKNFDYDLTNPEKIIMVGDQITDDVLFGGINNMANIWINN